MKQKVTKGLKKLTAAGGEENSTWTIIMYLEAAVLLALFIFKRPAPIKSVASPTHGGGYGGMGGDNPYMGSPMSSPMASPHGANYQSDPFGASPHGAFGGGYGGGAAGGGPQQNKFMV